MRINVHGEYLWVGMCVVGPKGMVGHGNEVWGDTYSPCGNEPGGTVHVKCTVKQHSKAGDADGRDVDGRTHGA